MFWWTLSDSVSWKPTVKQGLRLVIGSWKIMVSSEPMMLRRSLASIFSISLPSKRSTSAVTVAVQGNKPIRASMATDLPEPDSPTMETISPGSTLRVTPSTALN